MVSGKTLHQLFEVQAARMPDRVAVSGADRALTYRELNAEADAVAARLRAGGAGPDRPIGLCVDRSADLVVGLLGILKAGAAYVPVDPAYPADRVAFLLDDSQVSAVVSVSRVAERLTDCGAPVVWLDRDTEAPAAPAAPAAVEESRESDLAYVIYTSGSTGVPKGVLVEHRSVVRLFEQTTELVGYSADDVWTLFHSISFDFSVWELWGALLHGGRLVVAGTETVRSPELLHKLLADEGVTVLNQTPSAFRRLVGASTATLPALRLVVFGGERLDVKLLEPWFARYGDERPALVNMYGITETTVHVTARAITRADLDEPGVSPIGRPLPEVTLHLLDEDGSPVADGTPGELYVGGTGVARGYHRRPELTAERFRTVGTGADAVRLYRSGDRAVRTAGGEYLYVGRADDQIKIRGFRIEPGEIEALLADDPRLASAIVAPQDHGEGDVRLTAYLVPPPDAEIDDEALGRLVAEVSARAAGTLPEHMRPSAYRLITEVPTTAQGKVDRSALPALPHRQAPAGPAGAGAELTPTQQQVDAIVTEVLARPGIGLDDDLFEHGATSLAFMRVIASVNRRWKLSLTGAELDAATVRHLSACVDAQESK
ncbi:amino acid adenylation domain-containing protein [Streptomyces sp. NPDC088337]|uniref:amino acid adenylation domain-containing protein n=1 Tax=unclassified Streptomyces TaxID=2593676 RepID=UPI002DD87771|nr:amino acid adenylation domain-containing protein [Streptomyces sp. NBC_01788]WSB30239.1 amino acid adenylation domain-containing protein [Streptomyces sp. NBC_01788]